MRMPHAALIRTLAITACSLCLIVVVLGAYVRLTTPGLGCPDWPGCYGHFSPIGADARGPGWIGQGLARNDPPLCRRHARCC